MSALAPSLARVAWVLGGLLLLGCASRGEPASPPGPPAITELPGRSLSECARVALRDLGPLDVAFVLDVSFSTAQASGADVDGDGIVGVAPEGVEALFESGLSDPADSVLAAEVAGARSLVRHLADQDVRFAVVAFAEKTPEDESLEYGSIRRPGDSFILSSPSRDLAKLDEALAGVLELGSSGGARFAAGMATASRVLTADPQPHRSPQRVALMVSDSPRPLLTHPVVRVVDPQMKTAAVAAIRNLIRFHTFGLNEAAGTQPPHALSQIAGATGGRFTPVADATLLHCHMLRALLEP